ncbi:non-ribosomal peptide synthase domain TIGR01720/amino acid adenylation domain-containing protein [Methylomagnum ishizawai]|uniref:Non-ribosomal peptide synthase domain TIGR01720/amino acid adenylation domain-containing protein n=1 Tax=Methylomagnum ishizawai TaxID=1760988 RepID=A0A1Y6D477_9GAMM|nr:non-ribosomal peptide synthetase [Methylomagnum ishizawai]SMF97467.1 non-ribosomal peptide synthase domain TIGR01720/amino acid adenylation domain-containing protein [Methylomagnum ishizawai]
MNPPHLPLDNLSAAQRKALLLLLKRRGGDAFLKLPIARVRRDEPLPLSHGQQRLWFLAQLEPESSAYHLADAVYLRGPVDATALETALSALVARHESLRTRFPEQDGVAVQRIHAELRVPLRRVDLSAEPGDRRATAAALVDDTADQPFDLAQGPLLRALLVKLAEDLWVFALALHHIVADEWSLSLLIGEFAELYAAAREGRAPRLPELPVQYADYAAWQRDWLNAGAMARQLAYWRDRLGDEHPVLALPLDRPRPAVASDRGATLAFTLPDTLAADLARLCRAQGASLFMGLLAVFQALLYRQTGQADLRIGVPVANRHRPEIQGVVGFFVNTQVLRTELEGRLGFAAILARVKDAALGAQDHPDLPFDQLVEALRPERNLGHNPLFQVMYNHRRLEAATRATLDALGIAPFPREDRTTQFDLILDTVETADGQLSGLWTYAADLFERGTVERLARQFQTLLAAWVAEPGRPLAQLPLWTETERDRLAVPKATAQDHAYATPLHELIRRRAEQWPAALALVAGETHLSYGELEARARRLAHRLIQLGAGPETPVGVAVGRGVERVVCALAVLKAGGVYLPLDPDAPPERLRAILVDARVGVLVLERDSMGLAGLSGGPGYRPTLRLDDDVFSSDLPPQDASLPPVHPEQLAYVIHTSGSTGQPKGVAVSHRALALHCLAMGELFGMREDDRCLHFAASVFDAALEQWAVPLLHGAAVVIGAPSLWSVEQTLDQIAALGITRIDLPPAYLAELATRAELGRTPILRSVTAGGEALPRATWERVRDRLRPECIINAYGPTETVITPLAWTAPPGVECPTPYAPIGRVVGGRTAWVLDADLNPLPVGVAGELYIGGTGLARGYLHRPGPTAERFVPDPFGLVPGGRLYRTGDHVRRRADGTVEYLGRLDRQIKLRGFRIEPGEIESLLRQYPGVAEAAVLAREGGAGKILVAYVAGTSEIPSPDALTQYLAQRLPGYMVPSRIGVLDRLPRTSGGKLDIKALPEPERPDRPYLAPRTETEQRLADIWQDLLGVARVGLDDNFFALGGDSIVSLQVVSRARQAGIGIGPKEVFRHQTVAALAAAAGRLEMRTGTAAPATGAVPLTPIQREFFATPLPNRHHWNQSVLLETGRALDADTLESALRRLVEHHDALRLRYREVDGAWEQSYTTTDATESLWRREAADAQEIERIAQAAQRSLNLETGPLLRAVYIAGADGGYRLLLVVHHLVVDGVSWRILLEDLQTAYDRPAEALPARTGSFKAWAEHLRHHAASEPLRTELEYWSGLATGADGLGAESVPGFVRDATTLTLALDPGATRDLLQEAATAYRARVDELLLTVLARVWCRRFGQDSVLVALESHGREDLPGGPDISRTVGWFTSAYPVLLAPAEDWDGSVRAIKETLRQVPRRGIGYGLLKYQGDAAARATLGNLPRPGIGFNYLGQFDRDFGGDALFRPARESRGDEQDLDAPLTYGLDINGQVYGGELALNWTYSRAHHDTATVEALMAEFRAELLALIERRGVAQSLAPSDFPLARLSREQLDALPIPAADIADIYPPTPMQQGMLFHALYEPGGNAYVTQFDVAVAGLDPQRFQAAWEAAMRRHPILRTGFHWREDAPLQIVRRALALPLETLDWRGGDTEQTRLDALCRAESERGFVLAQPPLFRLTLVRLDATRHHLIWTCHHLLLDGWSSARLLAEVLGHYRGQPVAAPVADYREYIAWLQRRDTEADRRYWRECLEPLRQPTRLAEGLPVHPLGTGHGWLPLRFEPAATRRLQQLAQTRQLTLNTLVQGAWALLLRRYTGQAVVAFGATLSGRPADLPGAEDMVGLFINTLPVVQRPAPGRLAGEWLDALQRDNLELREHSATPLYDVQRWWRELAEDDTVQATGPLFDSLLVFENYPVDRALREGGGNLHFGPGRHAESTTYPLTLAIQSGETLDIVFDYAREQFDAATVAGLRAHFERLLWHLAEQPERRLGQLAMLGEDETARFAAWNTWARTWPVVPLHELIRRQAETRPDALAVVSGDTRLTYGELERRANRLAHRLIGRSAGPERVVGLALPRSAEMIVAMLATLKSGAAFLPLDPDAPCERRARLLDDAGVGVLVVGEGPEGDAGPGDRTTLRIDEDCSGAPDTPPPVVIHPGHLAYLIHTSGSTGTPKAVAVPHGALSRHLQAAGALYGLEPPDRALHFAAFSFDAAVEQWAAPLAHGAGLVLGQPGWTGEDTAAVVEREGVTVIYPPTPHLLHLADALAGRSGATGLRICTVGGEAVARDSLDRIRRGLRPAWVVNGYGPTETVITPLAWKAGPDTPCASAYAPIGQALGERTLHVLDADWEPVPLGVAGELYIGGPCLARGYFDRPGPTAERFIPDPWGEPGSRLYRTGDRVRQLADGTVEYLGRTDQQIKLRGYRIEPGEIEAALLNLPGVREAVVVLREDRGGRYLAGYVGADGRITANALRTALAARLPEYMVPAALRVLDALPRTAHGKVDRQRLPLPEPAAPRPTTAPRTDIERRLLAIWRDLLGRDDIGVTDNFFELGGDSILSIQAASRARRAGLAFTPKDLFGQQTIERLARVVRTAAPSVIAQGPASGTVPLIPIQAEFFARDIPNRQHWNQAVLLIPRAPLDPASLETALRRLLEQHDALRLRYRHGAEGWRQSYADKAEPEWLWHRAATDTAGIEAIAAEAQRSLDLERGPLLRAVHIRLTEGGERLLLVVHHLVVDGVSWRILLEDLQAIHAQPGQPLPPKTSAFQDWARHLAEYAQGNALRSECAYWETQLAGMDPAWPCDHPEAPARNRDAAVLRLRLDPEETRRLLHHAGSTYRTSVQDLLLAALARTLSRWTGQPEILVELEGHGREDLFPALDLTRTVGWFTTTYPVTLAAAADPGVCLRAVKERLRQVPHHGIGFGLLKSMAPPELRQRIAALPRPKLTFNYLGQFDASFDPERGMFAPAPENTGEERDPMAPLGNEFEINGEIYAGGLRLDWGYSRARYREDTVRGLADAYLAEIQALIDHCLGAVPGATPADFPLAGLGQVELDALHLPWGDIEDLYPLAPMQQGMLFHTLAQPGAGLYLTQWAAEITGLDPERFKQAWRDALDRHDILRTGFLWREAWAEPLQAVYRSLALPVEEQDWRDRDATPEVLAQLRADELQRGFDLERPPLLRLVLARLDERRYYLVWTGHHLLLDGWSQSQLMGEVLRGQGGLETGPPPAAGRYRDYIAWLARQDRAAGEKFWRGQLADLEQPCWLGAVPPRPGNGGGHGVLRHSLGAERTRALRDFAERQRITLNTLAQGAWALLLSRHSGRRAVAFGSTVSGRPDDLPGVENLLGLFINTLPVVHVLEPARPVGAWLRALQERNLGLREHGHLPLYDIQRWAGGGFRSGAGQALFDTLLVFENYPVDPALQASGLKLGQVAQDDATHYPLTVDIAVDGAMELGYDYDRGRFHEKDIRSLAAQMERLLLALAEDADRPVGRLGLAAASATGSAALQASHEPVHVSIQRQAATRPDAPALVFETGSLSYGELDNRANRLARRLIRLGVDAEIPVGVLLERGADAIVAALAVWKAGGVYLPLDPAYPQERLREMLEDAGAGILVESAGTAGCVDGGHGDMPTPRRLRLDWDGLVSESTEPPAVAIHPQQTAYLIYTSGSTGKPKGVAVAHGAFAAHCRAMGALYRLATDDRVLLSASLCFDAALDQWAVPLAHGAAVVPMGPDTWTPDRILRESAAQGITRLDLSPDYLAELAAEADPAAGPRWRSITVGGEALPRDTYIAAQHALRPERLVNAYGPTETVVTPLAWTAQPDSACPTRYAPIGFPVGGRMAYVLDADLNPLPPGVAGELYIGGAALARGYWRRPGWTAERFVPDPFAPSPGGRLYRSGDRARLLEDGAVEYLGRQDLQVKIRGHRIELEDIEARLSAHPAVAEAAARVWEGVGGAYLAAYVAPENRDLPETLKAYLGASLPEYMIPARIVALPKLPRLPNGKPDRASLPEPERDAPALVAPSTGAEQRMAELWRDILGLEQVGITDDFFELGGHSLLALRLVGLAERRMGLKLTLAQVLRFPTIAGLLRQSSDTTPLIALNTANHGNPPLFCIHPAGGAVFGYRPLAQSLARPVYGVLCPGFLDSAWNPPSLAAQAEDYARLLLEAQPEGRFHLLGWSLGGALALDVAHLLERAGREVAFLGLVDSYAPGFDEVGHTPEQAALDDLGGFLREHCPGIQADAWLARLSGTRIDETTVLTLLEEIAATPAGQALPDAAQLARSFGIMQKLSLLAREWRVRPLRVAPHCWWSDAAGDRAALAQARLEQGWGRPARNSARVAADHAAIVRAPEFLADLRTILEAGGLDAD